MQNIEGYQAGPHGVVQLSAQTASLKFGLWVNTTKNPRHKTADFPNLGISIDVSSSTAPACLVASCLVTCCHGFCHLYLVPRTVGYWQQKGLKGNSDLLLLPPLLLLQASYFMQICRPVSVAVCKVHKSTVQVHVCPMYSAKPCI